MEFTKLFEPIVINGKLEVKNRIVLPALGLDYTRNYNFNERSNVFFNAGYISRQPLFDAVFPNFANDVNPDLQNEEIVSF